MTLVISEETLEAVCACLQLLYHFCPSMKISIVWIVWSCLDCSNTLFGGSGSALQINCCLICNVIVVFNLVWNHIQVFEKLYMPSCTTPLKSSLSLQYMFSQGSLFSFQELYNWWLADGGVGLIIELLLFSIPLYYFLFCSRKKDLSPPFVPPNNLACFTYKNRWVL